MSRRLCQNREKAQDCPEVPTERGLDLNQEPGEIEAQAH